MKHSEIFQQYIWLVNTIYQAREISYKGINQRWIRSNLSGGVSMPRNTFNRHKDAIQEIFGIIIECDKKNGYKYYIENREGLRGDSVQNWMLSSMAVHIALQESLSLQSRILLEEIPSGQTYLQAIIDAMKSESQISFEYRKYTSSESKHYPQAEPYCLKLYKQRWYMAAKIEGTLKMYSLDRIESLEILHEPFQIDKDFNAEKFFHDCYGVYRDDKTFKQKVVLRAYGTETNYLRDLPLHHSQKEIQTCPTHSDFSYYLCPTDDFLAEILRKSDRLKVLEPQSLQDKIHALLKKMLKNYE